MLLVATPALVDPHFRRTVLLLSHHSREDGALGLVLNRPLHLTIGEMAQQKAADHLANVPLFYGGPVAADQPALVGVRWDEEGAIDLKNFASARDADEIPPAWRPNLRLFVGHSGWSPGQLESEIEHKSWLVIRPFPQLTEAEPSEELWRKILRGMDPMLKLLADAPEDPSLN